MCITFPLMQEFLNMVESASTRFASIPEVNLLEDLGIHKP